MREAEEHYCATFGPFDGDDVVLDDQLRLPVGGLPNEFTPPTLLYCCRSVLLHQATNGLLASRAEAVRTAHHSIPTVGGRTKAGVEEHFGQ
jgi:hypothetical protein